jgi:hypothetical protein
LCCPADKIRGVLRGYELRKDLNFAEDVSNGASIDSGVLRALSQDINSRYRVHSHIGTMREFCRLAIIRQQNKASMLGECDRPLVEFSRKEFIREFRKSVARRLKVFTSRVNVAKAREAPRELLSDGRVVMRPDLKKERFEGTLVLTRRGKRTGRGAPMAVLAVRERDTGNLPVRFDEREVETEQGVITWAPASRKGRQQTTSHLHRRATSQYLY